jgi:hypothetical protein
MPRKTCFRLPGTNNWDISVFKNFNLAREGKVRMQYRLELYNAFNHTQFTGVDTTGALMPMAIRSTRSSVPTRVLQTRGAS